VRALPTLDATAKGTLTGTAKAIAVRRQAAGA